MQSTESQTGNRNKTPPASGESGARAQALCSEAPPPFLSARPSGVKDDPADAGDAAETTGREIKPCRSQDRRCPSGALLAIHQETCSTVTKHLRSTKRRSSYTFIAAFQQRPKCSSLCSQQRVKQAIETKHHLPRGSRVHVPRRCAARPRHHSCRLDPPASRTTLPMLATLQRPLAAR